MQLHNVEQKITAGEHSFKADELERAVKFAKYLNYTLKITGVVSASGTPDGICFGDLGRLDLLDKSYIPGNGPDYDPQGIEWIVRGDIEITTEYGETYKQGDVITWEK